MKTVVQQMAFYEAYHKNPWNKATHFVGIPSIIFSILVAMSWAGISAGPGRITLAMAFVCGVLAYYFAIEPVLAAAMTLFILPVLFAAHKMSAQSWSVGLTVFLVAFIGGWILQIVGHVVFEKNRPALLDNFFQIFIAPLYFVAEIFFVLGFKHDLQAAILATEAANRPTRRTSRTGPTGPAKME